MCEQSKNPYISCIKLNGQPILPPLLTAEKRIELQTIKQQAIEIERKLKSRKYLQDNLLELLSIPQLMPSSSDDEPDSKHSHLDALQISPANLTQQTIDVSQYDSSGVTVLETPRLIRSNSYILDTPSPMLLAHMEKEKQVLQTDVTVEQLTVNFESDFQTQDDGVEIDAELMKVLQNIPDHYSSQIVEVMRKQKQEQIKRFETFEKLKQDILNDSNAMPHEVTFISKKQSSVEPLSVGVKEEASVVSVSSQSLYFTLSPNTPTMKLIDLEDEEEDESRFPNAEWAASVIGAHVRGYLVRRLLKTERVQALIDTIKNALMCALELHQADNIDQADVDLHRRLIQQISAACFAFHDIFFALPIREQMAMISVDRSIRLEKANRPVSAPRSRISSARSLTNV